MPTNTYAQHGSGTGLFACLFYDPAPDTISGLVVVAEIPQMVSDKIPLGSFTDVKTTHLKSYRKFNTYIPGFGEAGDATFQCRYSESNLNVLMGLRPAPTDGPPDYGALTWYEVAPDGSILIFNGYLKTIDKGTGEDDAVVLDCSIKITGPVNFQHVTT